MSQVSQSEAAASSRSPRGRKDEPAPQSTEERFTPLRPREEHTFSQMTDDGADRAFLSPICFRRRPRD